MNRFYGLTGAGDHVSWGAHFFSPLLEKEMVSGLLLPKETSSGSILHSFIRDKGQLAGSQPLAPLMLSSGACAVSNLTFKGVKEKVAAILRPCEIRALVELVKLKQVDREKVLIIGTDCLGTLERNDYQERYQELGEELFSRYYQGLIQGQIEGLPIREACRLCLYPAGVGSDIHMATIGTNHGSFFLEALTPEGEEVLLDLALEEVEPPPGREGLLRAIKKQREETSVREREAFAKDGGDFARFLEKFAYCMGCHNCRTNCPLCYCRECIFTTLVFEHDADRYLKWAQRKGALRLPADTILFHLTRLNHMGLSCVGCGLCESACPSGVPLLKIFKYMGAEAQALFSYVPGAHGEEPIPLTTYREEELEPR